MAWRWRYWRERLEQNAQRPIPGTEAPAWLTPTQHALVLRSLQEFQLGETGEGRVAHQIDGVTWEGVDDDLRALIKLWVREEGRHARVLALMVRGMGGKLLTRHWSTGAFQGLRRRLGVRFKLFVALTAEVAGAVFYGLLARALPRSPMASALEELERDEGVHLRFQSELFGMLGRHWLTHVAIQAGWLFFALGVSAMVWWQHAPTLASLGVPFPRTAFELVRYTVEVSRRIHWARRAAVAAPAPARLQEHAS
ncbi:MAG TPA: ferritin-like domain-containing protein [Myxococcaceae bacterium]|nr:ferritin-like domain-containing protein [Myxococcaceae bacterium]